MTQDGRTTPSEAEMLVTQSMGQQNQIMKHKWQKSTILTKEYIVVVWVNKSKMQWNNQKDNEEYGV